jgi:hypothetical protein
MTSSQLDSGYNPLRSVWTARWVFPHESAYIWLQKYAWANLAGASEIAREVFGRPRLRVGRTICYGADG